MQIKKNHVVTLHYKLTEDDANGEFIEETYNSDPLIFIYGIGMMVPAFEQHLEGKMQEIDFHLHCNPRHLW
ncbi:MAG: FKBP-type peptidyl-prolyl cis-trans isomerase [Chitinophagales bacterium]|nr:FKBP-type peptidyl-prolyl cis-trans isomerase [Chitinophagales bacterium]